MNAYRRDCAEDPQGRAPERRTGSRRAADGRVLARLTDTYSLVIHPYITGAQVGVNGEFVNSGDRSAVLRMLVQLHHAHAATPRADDFVVPHLDALRPMLSDPRGTWLVGPYAQGPTSF